MCNQATIDLFNFIVPLGTEVSLVGDHPHAGKVGKFAGLERVGLLRRLYPKITLPDESSCFVFKPEQWQPARGSE